MLVWRSRYREAKEALPPSLHDSKRYDPLSARPGSFLLTRELRVDKVEGGYLVLNKNITRDG